MCKLFGKLVVVSKLPNNRVHCYCSCGKYTSPLWQNIRRGFTTSCGCIQAKTGFTNGKNNTVHGEGNKTPEYTAWKNMKRRCYASNLIGYKNYGGRGIKVCKKWRRSYVAFLCDMGRRTSKYHSLDRINNDGNYKPSNCRWATRTQQNNNQRRTK